jgi:hypothetical protein
VTDGFRQFIQRWLLGVRFLGLAIQLRFRQIGMHRLAFLVLHHHVVPRGGTQFVVRRYLVSFGLF